MNNTIIDKKNGSIKLIIGCMYSGKTSQLIREINKWKSIGVNILVINYEDDNRYGTDNFMYSHDKIKTECIKVKELSKINDDTINKYSVIVINEGQFFKDLEIKVTQWCETLGKKIIVSGLDGDFQRKPFGQILSLIPIADEIIKTKALCNLCKDGTSALFSWRLTGELEQTVIGNTNYIPICRKHYCELSNTHLNKINSS